MKHKRVLTVTIWQERQAYPLFFKVLIPEDLAQALTISRVIKSEFVIEDHQIIKQGVSIKK